MTSDRSTTSSANAAPAPRHPAQRWAGQIALVACALAGPHAGALGQSLDLIDFNAQRSQVLAQLHQVPEQEIRQRYLRCTHVASVRALTMGESTLCTMVSDVLLARTFGGDQEALLAWWRERRDPALWRLEP